MQDDETNRSGLVQEILRDREKGAARLVAERHGMLYAAAFSLCGDASMAEDLVFRTFERVLDRIATCRDESAFDAWMKAILRNEWLLSVRGSVVRATDAAGAPDEVESLADVTDGGADIRRAVDQDIVRRAIEDLPSDAREVLLLHYFMDMPVAQVARFLAMPVGTVKSRLHYARLALSHRLRVSGHKAALLVAALLLCGIGAWAAISGVLRVSGAPPDAVETPELRQRIVRETREALVAYYGELPPDPFAETARPDSATTQTNASMNPMNTATRTAALGAATALALGAPASGDGFFVSGWPVADPSHTAVSTATSLAADPAHDTSPPSALDARDRTTGLSGTTALRSDEYNGFMLIIR